MDCEYSINITDHLQEYLTGILMNLCKYNLYYDKCNTRNTMWR
jgi:hypothetical protein